MTTTAAATTTTTAEKLYYYVSIAFYGHKVFKCAGHGAEDLKHREFYLDHFRAAGHAGREENGPYEVLILPFIANRITRDGKPFTAF